jgi:hypothetical protein
MRKTLSLLFVICLVAFVVSCKKDKTTIDPEIPYTPIAPTLSTSLTGFGSHYGVPSGAAWAFPASIKVVGSILGGNPGKEAFADSKTYQNWENYVTLGEKTTWETHGLGVFVNLYMKLYNTSSNMVSFVFPAGLMFINDSTADTTVVDTAQTGIIIIPDTVTIPGGDTINLCLKSFCCNSSRHAPGFTSIYEPKVVSNNDQIYRLIGALKGKTTLPTHESDILSYIWKIGSGTPLTADDWATIATWQ